MKITLYTNDIIFTHSLLEFFLNIRSSFREYPPHDLNYIKNMYFYSLGITVEP